MAHFHRLGLQKKDLSKSDIKYIRGAGGGTHTILWQILLPIRVADVELMQRFYVIDQVGYNCLFGIDFLQQNKSNRKAMNRNWSNQKSNPALKTKAGNK